MQCVAFNTHFPRIHTYLVYLEPSGSSLMFMIKSCAGCVNIWPRMHLLVVISAISRQLHDEVSKKNKKQLPLNCFLILHHKSEC